MPRLRSLLLLLLALTGGCREDAGGGKKGPPGEDFAQDHTVRILSPAHGDTVGTTFSVEFEAGADVREVRFVVDGAAATVSELDAGGGTAVVTVAEGARRRLGIQGLDAGGELLSEHTVQLVVQDDAEAPWAAITSPSDGEVVYNPVQFAVTMSGDLERVELRADGWALGDVDEAGRLSYSFTGTGYPRVIEAVGYRGGEEVTRDQVTVTVDAGTEPVESDFNALMMDFLDEYPTDGSFEYWWPDASESDWLGHPHDIYYQGELFSRGDSRRRSYCVGLTWELFMRAFEEADRMTGGDGSLNGMTADDLDDFRVLWFIVNINGDENVDALENYGLGERVTDLEDARPGDVVQFWRNSGSGHNNIFIEWERDGDGDIIGLTYWSTQGTTDGIGYNTEYFGASGSTINPSYLFIARPYMPDLWLPWH